MKLRIPQSLKDCLDRVVKSSGRTMNAEIVARLDFSLRSAAVLSEDLTTADQARALAAQALKDGFGTVLRQCMIAINASAVRGDKAVDVVVPGYSEAAYWEEANPVFIEVLSPVLVQLQALGYRAEIVDQGIRITY